MALAERKTPVTEEYISKEEIWPRQKKKNNRLKREKEIQMNKEITIKLKVQI